MCLTKKFSAFVTSPLWTIKTPTRKKVRPMNNPKNLDFFKKKQMSTKNKNIYSVITIP